MTYQATIDPRFLEKVDRVFDASPRTVFDELIQNARRAGATEVRVSLQTHIRNDVPCVAVTFQDNGKGIESPRPLLNLAGQDWDVTTDAREDPAGMGFFCLSNFDRVGVRSRHWHGIFTPRVFRGKEKLETTDMSTGVFGTIITWFWDDMYAHTLANAVKAAAVYCGLQRVLVTEGAADPDVVIPVGFLDGAVVRRKLPALGAEIGAVTEKGRRDGPPSLCLNFYGVGLSETGLPRDISGLPVSVRVDVTMAGALQLVLPARNALKHNSARAELFREAERTVYEWIAHTGTAHELPFSVYARARDEFGIDIGEARQDTLTAVGDRYWYSPTSSGERVIVNPSLLGMLGFADLLYGAAPDIIPCRPQDRSEGYKWYDALPRIVDARVFIDGVEQDLDEFYGYQNLEASESNCQWAESLKVVFELEDGATLEYEPPVLSSGEGCEWEFESAVDTHRFYVSRRVRDDVKLRRAAIDDICAAVFEANCGSDCETPVDSQRADFEAEVCAALLRFIGDDIGAAKTMIERAMTEGQLACATVDDWVWSIHRDAREGRRGAVIVGPHRQAEVDDCRKVACYTHADGQMVVAELASRTPVTLERAAAYFRGIVDGVVDPASIQLAGSNPPVDLDEWEGAQTK